MLVTSFGRFPSGDGFSDPPQVARRSVFNRQGDAFWEIVGVEFGNCLAHLGKGRGRCLDDQKPFASFFYFALPAIDGFDLGDDINAGGDVTL